VNGSSGFSGRSRTYNPSANSRVAYSPGGVRVNVEGHAHGRVPPGSPKLPGVGMPPPPRGAMPSQSWPPVLVLCWIWRETRLPWVAAYGKLRPLKDIPVAAPKFWILSPVRLPVPPAAHRLYCSGSVVVPTGNAVTVASHLWQLAYPQRHARGRPSGQHCGSGGRGFESHHPPHTKKRLTKFKTRTL